MRVVAGSAAGRRLEAPPGTAPEWGIPTSHYAAVQMDCTATISDDTGDIRATLADVELATDRDLLPVPPGSSLSHTLGHLRAQMGAQIAADRPDLVIVQGDTSTAYAGALAARDAGVALAHVEAGLRTSNPLRPFPEEPFRRRIAPIARWHFAPTTGARQHLLDEGVAADRVHVVGNTIVDEFACGCTTNAQCAGIGAGGRFPSNTCYNATVSVCGPACNTIGGNAFCSALFMGTTCDTTSAQCR